MSFDNNEATSHIEGYHKQSLMKKKKGLRLLFVALIASSVLTVGFGYASGESESTLEKNLNKDGVKSQTEQVVAPRENITVVATDSNSWRGQESEGPRARAELVAFNANGSILYYNDTHTRYWDVDPVPGTRATVEYMYADHLESEKCPTNWNIQRRGVNESVWEEYLNAQQSVGACTENGVERVNLTTGAVTDVWSEMTPGKEATRYHDADRLNETHLVVADIYLDRVFVVNTETNRTEWTWNASSEFSKDTGGPYPEDWTHINDVNVVSDGRIMVSARNQDRAIFLNESGLIKSWTLGEEDNYNILYEQHNPDYIPATEGGPAVLVADSENNRIVEYQRENGSWNQSFVWRDARTQWPRDADRLPNNHTLVTDSNGNRVFEIDENGEVVWSVNVAFPYEAERLGTGDESAGGSSAAQADIKSNTGDIDAKFWILVKQFIPGKYLNGLMYITPVWIGIVELFALVVLVGTGLIWGITELYWRRPLF
ncbi:arylsulfotransferase family protein [Halogranum rubrum]|uniref:Arylsulfotransferase (Asst) n=1 Tax=Halogranum salarium B-1 TaxID=1210908 RepID=J3JCY0_9EURY|nr:arylsulfotransferase family protein [Halogranum salarium]EJN57006.1 hypothetical protein HSB1_48230 [Halogranum salarium B-1]